jgi:Virulence factor BrkB
MARGCGWRLVHSPLVRLRRFALAWYLGREAEASAYGAATSLVLLLIWVYYSAQILFLGAQFSQSLQNEQRRPTIPADETTAAEPPGAAVAGDRYFSNVMAALGLGFVVGAAAMQRPRGRVRGRQPGPLQKAYAYLLSLMR